MLSAESLEHLRRHKYQTTGYTVLDTKVLNPFWEAFVKMMPMWLAPNLVTVIGLCCMVLSYGVMAWYDLTFTKQVPCCVLCFSAFLQFMYQTLDACDGKQARRTGSASPLGMLVDHGCDSLTTTIMTLTLIQCLGLGHDFNLRLLAFGMWGVFYIATWEEYHTHFCRTQLFNFGVTENQLFAMFLIVTAGVLKIEFYAAPVTVMGVTLELRVAILYFMVGLSTCTQAMMVISCLHAAPSKLTAIVRLLPIVMLNGATYCVSHYSTVYHQYPSVFFVLFGLFFSLVVGRLIISSVTKVLTTQTHFSPMQWEVLAFYVFAGNTVWLSKNYADVVSEEVAFGALAAIISISYVTFVLRIVKQLTKVLEISFFTIKPKTA